MGEDEEPSCTVWAREMARLAVLLLLLLTSVGSMLCALQY